MKTTFRLALLISLSALSLAGCSSWLGEKEAAPLPGKREPVLQAPAADAAEAQQNAGEITPITLPEPATNEVWGQSLAYPTHDPEHLSLSGVSKKLWSSSVGEGVTRTAPIMPSPVIAEGRVYAQDTTGHVLAFDVKTGKQLWRVSTRGDKQPKDDVVSGGGVSYGRNMIISTSGSRDVVALNAQTGAMLWRTPLTAPLRGSAAVVAGRAYVTDVLNNIIALDQMTGKKLWSYTGTPSDIALFGSPAPSVSDHQVVAALSNGSIVSLDLTEGQQQWESRFSNSLSGDPTLTDLRDVAGVPVTDDGRVYAANAAGRVVALNALSGARLWQKDARATGSVWAVGTVLYLQTREGIAARSAETGDVLWDAALPAFEDEKDKEDPITWYGPYLLSGKIYAFGSAGQAMIFDPVTGKSLGVLKIEDNLAAPPAIAGGMAVLLTASGALSAWQ